MNIILIPGKVAKGRNISLSHGQVVTVSVVLLAILPMVFGAFAYHIAALLDRAAAQDPEYLQAQAQSLLHERQTLVKAREKAEAHLNALAYKLGELQAQIVRLNALGSRLAHLAGLDKRGEFDFSESPAVGGPESKPSTIDVSELVKSLAILSANIADRSDRLTSLETVLFDRKFQAASTPSGSPVEGGWVSSGFGLRTDPFTGHQAYHEGIDIADRLNAPIHALGAGVVVYAGPKDGYGLMVEINHGRGQHTRYAHARSLLVKEGDKIEKGQVIALVGSSGRSTGPHVHVEYLRDGRAIDPQAYLKLY